MIRILFLIFLQSSCSTDIVPQPATVVEPDRYTLERNTFIDHPDPLPDEIRIDVVWHFPDGTKKKVPGYVAWDFNGDSHFDMVDVLDDSQRMTSRAFDFTLNGQMDRILTEINKMAM